MATGRRSARAWKLACLVLATATLLPGTAGAQLVTADGQRIQHVGTPTASDDAASKDYVDTHGGGGTGGGLSAPVANSSLATMSAHTFKINNTGSSATPVDATISQVKTELNYTPADIGAQPSDADLTAWAGLSWAADTCGYYTGAGTAATYSCPSAFRTFAAATTAAAQRAAMGVAIGTNVEQWDADLDAIASQTSAANKILYATGAQAWALTDYTAAARAFDALTSIVAENNSLNVTSSNIASASTVDLSTATGNTVNVTGSTGPITSLGTVGSGAIYRLIFVSTPTLTYNATSMILPGAVNMTVAAGDTHWFLSLGSGNWKCIDPPTATGTVTSVGATSPVQSSGGSTPNISLAASGIATGACGDATHVGVVTYESHGLGTNCSSTAIALAASNLTNGVVGTGAVPLVSGATVTGWTLNGTSTFGGAVAFGDNPITTAEHSDGNKSGAAPALANFSNTSPNHVFTITANITGAPTWTMPSAAGHLQIGIIQGTGGGFTMAAWPSSPTISWSGTASSTTPPTLQTAAGAEDIVSCWYNGSTLACAANQSVGAGITAGTGDATFSGTGSVVVTNINAPTGFTHAGTVVNTEIAAPSTPSAGKVTTWTDSTDARFHDKNPAGTVGTTVVASTAGTNQFCSSVSATGVVGYTQPSFANLSGLGTCAQEPALTGVVTSSAGSCTTAFASTTGTGATVQAVNPTLAGATLSADLTTGGNSVLATKAYGYTPVAIGNKGGASPSLVTWSAGSWQSLTQNSSITGTPTWTLPAGSQNLRLDWCMDATGGYAFSGWPSGITWDGGVAPVPSTVASACTRFTFSYNGTTVIGSSGVLYAKLVSPAVTTPTLGAATATSIAMGNGVITAAKAVYLNGKVAGGNKTGAAVALFDWTQGPFQAITLTGNVTGTSTCTAPTSSILGLTALVAQDATGSRTVASWCPGTKWVGGAAPTLSTTASRVDRITCDYDGTNYWCKAEINLQ